MIDVRILPNIIQDGLDIWVTLRGGDGAGRMVLGYQDGARHWHLLDPGSTDVPEPTLTVTDEAGRALLDALLRHYEGASDMRTVRGDLLYERGRVDKLLETVCRIAGWTVQS